MIYRITIIIYIVSHCITIFFFFIAVFSVNRTTTTSDGESPAKGPEYPEIKPDRYPPSFADVVPKSVLHAYFHAR